MHVATMAAFKEITTLLHQEFERHANALRRIHRLAFAGPSVSASAPTPTHAHAPHTNSHCNKVRHQRRVYLAHQTRLSYHMHNRALHHCGTKVSAHILVTRDLTELR